MTLLIINSCHIYSKGNQASSVMYADLPGLIYSDSPPATITALLVVTYVSSQRQCDQSAGTHMHAACINTPIKTRSLHNHRGSFMLVLLTKKNTTKPKLVKIISPLQLTTKHLRGSHLMPSKATVPQLGNACSYSDSLTKVVSELAQLTLAYAISLK